MSEIILYTTEDGIIKINVQLDNETVWLTQKQLVELYQTAKSTVSEHIKNIYTHDAGVYHRNFNYSSDQ